MRHEQREGLGQGELREEPREASEEPRGVLVELQGGRGGAALAVQSAPPSFSSIWFLHRLGILFN